MSHYPKPDSCSRSFSRNKIKVKLNVSNNVTKSDLKRETGISRSESSKKNDSADSKSNVDKIDVVKLETVPTDLSKLSNVVKSDFVENTTYDELVKKS